MNIPFSIDKWIYVANSFMEPDWSTFVFYTLFSFVSPLNWNYIYIFFLHAINIFVDFSQDGNKLFLDAPTIYYSKHKKQLLCVNSLSAVLIRTNILIEFLIKVWNYWHRRCVWWIGDFEFAVIEIMFKDFILLLQELHAFWNREKPTELTIFTSSHFTAICT